MKKLLLAVAPLLLVGCWSGQAFAATCFWVGGSATWDSTNTGGGGTGGIKWASASGGGSACAGSGTGGSPGSGDSATFDGASGGGTVTVNKNVTVVNFTWGAFTGTIDWSVNNNTLAVTNSFNGSGTGARTWKNSSGAITVSGTTGTVWTMQTTTSLTLSPTASTFTSPITFSAASGAARTWHTGGLTYSTVTINDSTIFNKLALVDTSSTITSLTMTGPAALVASAGTTITNAFTWTGTSSNPILLESGSPGVATSITLSNAGSTGTWTYLSDITFVTNTATFNNSFQLGNNSGSTVNAPTFGGGGVGVIGGAT